MRRKRKKCVFHADSPAWKEVHWLGTGVEGENWNEVGGTDRSQGLWAMLRSSREKLLKHSEEESMVAIEMCHSNLPSREDQLQSLSLPNSFQLPHLLDPRELSWWAHTSPALLPAHEAQCSGGVRARLLLPTWDPSDRRSRPGVSNSFSPGATSASRLPSKGQMYF